MMSDKILRRILFGSLAPRTRKFIRTAAIAVISAIVLVTIFHLARLAENPVADNSNEVSNLVDTEDIEVKQRPQSYAGLIKDHRGKVVHHDDKVIAGVVDDLLAKAGPDAVLHPSLGVPVSKRVLEMDMRRKFLMRKRYSQPANATEIDKTLALVQKTANQDKKKLASKTLRLWTPDDSPLRILLVTTWRSGSTFLGQVLQQHPGVYQHYEPLSHIGIRQVRSGKDAFQAHQLVHRLLECKYEGLDKYMNYTRENPQDMLGHNRRVWEACKEGPNANSCFNTVRDPRATMSSRYSSVSWCADNPECSAPDILCNDLQGDLKVATAFKKLYPNKFTMIKYEDLALEPEKEIQNLMDFLGMEYSSDISTYVREHTESDLNQPWSTKRKSSDRIYLWKKQLPLTEIHTVQNACESVIKTLGYELMGQ